MLNRLSLELAKRLMQPINPSLVALLGIYTILWGFWVGNPWWDVFTQAPLYSEMQHFPEWAWGAFALISGLEILRGVVRNRNKDLRRGAFVGFFHWLVVTLMYFVGDWKNTGGITAALLTVYCFIIFLNYRRNKDYPNP